MIGAEKGVGVQGAVAAVRAHCRLRTLIKYAQQINTRVELRVE